MTETDWYKRFYAYVASNNVGLSQEQFDRVMEYARKAASMKEDLSTFRVRGNFRDGDDSPEGEQDFLRPVLVVDKKSAFTVSRNEGPTYAWRYKPTQERKQ